ncbi:metallophosphoesterase family protein [Algicella marina]|uniref:Serine/threonine protein phosphatase n=1 Tax=Algicella marina TaxID=2683284 RepID=A0A6P1T2L8_9RHOB|nr:metallophosphoesterase [Algicella marina]QHQ37174.1 serine/threonine protein phosphatase [Algicella marina]
MVTRVMAFSDLHLSRAKAEVLVAASGEADLVIGAGDFCNMREGLDGAMSLLKDMARPFVLVPGNAESAEELRDAAHAGMTVLHGEACEAAGLALFGLGYAVPETPFGAWSCDLSEAAAGKMLAGCVQADILITHSPPKGVADVTSAGQSVGSVAVREAIERIQPRLAVCGHIHDSWGSEGMIGATQVVNLGPEPRFFEM